MSEQKSYRRRSSGGGMSLITLTWVILLILKLAGPLDHMKWYWVFSPIWISASLGVLFLLCIGGILLAAVVGIIGASSGTVVGIKNWFRMQEQEEVIDVQKEDIDDQ
ncbi:MAG: hypothetical protein FK732_01860 [Asgard group archaeon]|nr:hypothetical protein [Asgard group archaeon]